VRVARNRRRRPDVGSEDTCHSFMAVNPHLFRDGGEFEADLDAVIEVLHDTPPADADLSVLVPGDPEAMNWADRARTGIPVPTTLIERLRGVCERAGVPCSWTTPRPDDPAAHLPRRPHSHHRS
jgi:LDH2 family malate/lactate/ureidoglycolate dehydrogenase